VDALAILSTYRRHLPLFLVVMAVVAVVVTGVLISQPKAYTATATILMVSADKDLTNHDRLATQPTDAAQSSNVDTQVEVLKSPALAEAVVDSLNLVADPEFNAALRKPQPGLTPAIQHQAVVDIVNSRVKARRIGETYMASVSFSSRNPVKAARIVNAFAQQFIEYQRKVKMDAAGSATALLDSRLESLRNQAEADDAAVQQYKAAHGLISAEGSMLSEREIADTGLQLSLTRAQQAEAEARLNSAEAQMRNGSNGEDVGAALTSPVVQDLRRQRAEISANLAEMRQRLGPKHPDILQAQQQLADIDSQIQAEVSRLLTNLKSEAEIARQRTASLEASLAAARNNLAANGVASVGLNQLQQTADASKQLYLDFLTQYKQTAQDQSVTQPNAQIASQAEAPLRPSSPNKPLAVLMGILLGAGVGVLAVLVRQALESGLRTQEDVENKLDMPYLAGVPILTSAIKNLQTKSPIEAIIKHPLSGFAEAFRTIATTLSAGGHDNPIRCIALTSSLPNEGKTTTAICMAQILALGGASVILLDCDLRRRNVNTSLKFNATKGLLDVLAGRMSIEDALIIDEKTGVNYLVLPSNAVATTKSPIDTPAFDALLARLKTMYDYVVLDTPPLIPIVDSRILAQKVDAVVLLVRWQQTPRKAAEQSIKLLAAVGVRPFGVVLTQVDLKAQQRYGYGDSSYYYKGYRDYYLDEKEAKAD
jgi:capsular exopolysaccharide synthesis family protein